METADTHIMTLRQWSVERLAMTFDKGAAVAALNDLGGSLPRAALQIAGDPFPFWREAYKRRVFGGEAERVTLAQLIEFRDVRGRVLAGAVPYDSSMEYTHFENLDRMALPHAVYHQRISRFPVPTCPKALAERAKVMILTGFVQHRAFDDCFEMGNGGDVMALLINQALSNNVLKTSIILAEHYIGAWDDLVTRHRDKAAAGDLFDGEAAS